MYAYTQKCLQKHPWKKQDYIFFTSTSLETRLLAWKMAWPEPHSRRFHCHSSFSLSFKSQIIAHYYKISQIYLLLLPCTSTATHTYKSDIYILQWFPTLAPRLPHLGAVNDTEHLLKGKHLQLFTAYIVSDLRSGTCKKKKKNLS